MRLEEAGQLPADRYGHILVEGAADPASGKNNVIWRTICQETFDTAVTDALTTFTTACLDL